MSINPYFDFCSGMLVTVQTWSQYVWVAFDLPKGNLHFMYLVWINEKYNSITGNVVVFGIQE